MAFSNEHRPPRRLPLRRILLSSIALCSALAAAAARGGDAPSRVVPSPFVDSDERRSCTELIIEQRIASDSRRDIAAIQAAVHSCVKGRITNDRLRNPERHPTHGRPEASRPK